VKTIIPNSHLKQENWKKTRPTANGNQSRGRLKTEVSDPKASPEERRHHAFTANMTLGYRILKQKWCSPCEDPSGRRSAWLRASRESNIFCWLIVISIIIQYLVLF
jgi:hypothetical protein